MELRSIVSISKSRLRSLSIVVKKALAQQPPRSHYQQPVPVDEYASLLLSAVRKFEDL